MNKKSPRVITNHRSAVTGKFVTERYVKSHPATTVTERNRLPVKGKSK
jgi:hypothetical protein